MPDSNGTRAGFDANARAQRRESAPVVIGDATYHPARLTNKRLREVRATARKYTAQARVAGRESPEYQEAYDEAIEAKVDEAEAKAIAEDAGAASDEVAAINQASLRTQLPILLRDADMKPPTEDAIDAHLEEDLDARDVGDLMTYLLGAEEDPTPTPTTTSPTTP